jgi:hypothetical protein
MSDQIPTLYALAGMLLAFIAPKLPFAGKYAQLLLDWVFNKNAPPPMQPVKTPTTTDAAPVPALPEGAVPKEMSPFLMAFLMAFAPIAEQLFQKALDKLFNRHKEAMLSGQIRSFGELLEADTKATP